MGTVDKPDWLVDGAEVVVVRHGNRTEGAFKARIKKVSTKSFTLEGSPSRFRNDTQIHHEPGTWSGYSQVFPRGSTEADEALRRKEHEQLKNKVDALYLLWQRGHTEPKRQALIDALQALAPKKED
jgi:hypothetical protein